MLTLRVNKASTVYTGRQGMLGKVVWDSLAGWPAIRPMGKQAALASHFRDDFSAPLLSAAWQWDFRHSQPTTLLQKGVLSLAGRVTERNLTGTALTVRPLTGTYDLVTEIAQRNASLKGLVLYGDVNQAVGVGTQHDTIKLWAVKDDKRAVLQQAVSTGRGPLQVKLSVAQGYQCRFFWREPGKQWQELKTDGAYYNGDFLPIWDRSPRPGLVHQGVATAPAHFSFFEISYQ